MANQIIADAKAKIQSEDDKKRDYQIARDRWVDDVEFKAIVAYDVAEGEDRGMAEQKAVRFLEAGKDHLVEYKIKPTLESIQFVHASDDSEAAGIPKIRLVDQDGMTLVLPDGSHLTTYSKWRNAWFMLTRSLGRPIPKAEWPRVVEALGAMIEDVYPGDSGHADSIHDIEECKDWVREYLETCSTGVWDIDNEEETAYIAQSVIDQSLPHTQSGKVYFFIHSLQSWIHGYRGENVRVRDLGTRLRDSGFTRVIRRYTKGQVQRRVWTGTAAAEDELREQLRATIGVTL